MPKFDYGKRIENGQYENHPTLSKSEREKGFKRPVRSSYVHKSCGGVTSMVSSIAETYAADPSYYDATFCMTCGDYFPVSEFLWDGTEEEVGS